MGKERILHVLEILRKTDEANALTLSDIIDKLHKYGIEVERKAVSRDIQTLIDSGYAILSAGKREGYYLSEGLFEDYELLMLYSAVTRAKFITTKDSRAILKKLNAMSPPSMEKLLNEMEAGDGAKTDNKEAKYAISAIITALKENKKISFKYYEYAEDGKKRLRRDGHTYNVSPFYLAWVGDELFMIANPDSHNWLTHFNVAKMTKTEVLETFRKSRGEIEELSGRFNLGQHIRESMNMYTGDTIEVSLRCHKDILYEVIATFGADIWTKKSTDEWVKVNVRAKDNSGLYRWVMQYGDRIEVLSPDCIRIAVKDAITKTLKNYCLEV